MNAIVDPRLGFVCSHCHERHASLCDGCAAPAELTLEEAVDALALARRRESLQEAVALLASRGIVLARRLMLVLALLAGVAHGQTPTPTATATPRYWTGWLPFGANAAVTSGAGDNDGYECYTGACDITCGTPMSTVGTSADGTTCQDRNAGTTNNSTTCNASGRDQHRFSSFGVSIPAGSAVLGVAVKVVAGADSATTDPKLLVNLGDASAPYAGSLCIASAVLSAGSLTTYTFGSSNQMWNIAGTLTEAAVESANFSVYVTNGADGTARDFYLDYLAIAVYYAPPGPTPPPNGVQWFDGYEAGELTNSSYVGRLQGGGAIATRTAMATPIFLATPAPTPGAGNRWAIRFAPTPPGQIFQSIPLTASSEAAVSCWVRVTQRPAISTATTLFAFRGSGGTDGGYAIIEPAVNNQNSVWLKAYYGSRGAECLASGNNYTACTESNCPLPTPTPSGGADWSACECRNSGAPGEQECADNLYASWRLNTGIWYQVGLTQDNGDAGSPGAVGLTLTLNGNTHGQVRAEGVCAGGDHANYACTANDECPSSSCTTAAVTQIDEVRIGPSGAGGSNYAVIDLDSCVAATSATALTYPYVAALHVDPTPTPALLSVWVPVPTGTPAQVLLADLTGATGKNDTDTYLQIPLYAEGAMQVAGADIEVPSGTTVLGLAITAGIDPLNTTSGMAFSTGVDDGGTVMHGYVAPVSTFAAAGFQQAAYSLFPTRPSTGTAWTEAALDAVSLRLDQVAVGGVVQAKVTSLLGQVAIALPTPQPALALSDKNSDGKIIVCLWGDSTLDNSDYVTGMDVGSFNATSVVQCTSGGKRTADILRNVSSLLNIVATVSTDYFYSWACREQKAASLPVGEGCDYVVTMSGVNDFSTMQPPRANGKCYSANASENGKPCTCRPEQDSRLAGFLARHRCYRGAHIGDACVFPADCGTCVGGTNSGAACTPRCANNGTACGRCVGGTAPGADCAAGSCPGGGTCELCSGSWCNVNYDCAGGGTCEALTITSCANSNQNGRVCAIAAACPTPTGGGTPTCGVYNQDITATSDPDATHVRTYCSPEVCEGSFGCATGVCLQRHSPASAIKIFTDLFDAIEAAGAVPIVMLPPDNSRILSFGWNSFWKEANPQLAWLRGWLRTLAQDRGYNWIDLHGAFKTAPPYVDPDSGQSIPAPVSNYRDGAHYRLGAPDIGQYLSGQVVGACLRGNPESNPHVHCDDL